MNSGIEASQEGEGYFTPDIEVLVFSLVFVLRWCPMSFSFCFCDYKV